jgi:hypothetical protein
MIRVVPKFQSGGQTPPNANNNKGVSLDKYRGAAEKQGKYLVLDSEAKDKSGRQYTGREIAGYTHIGVRKLPNGEEEAIYARPELANYYVDFRRQMAGYEGDPILAFEKYANDKKLSPADAASLLELIRLTTEATDQGWRGTNNVDPFLNTVYDSERGTYFFRKGAGTNPLGYSGYGELSNEAFTLDANPKRTLESVGAPNDKYARLYNKIANASSVGDIKLILGQMRLIPNNNVDAVFGIIDKKEGITNEKIDVFRRWLEQNNITGELADTIIAGLVDYAGGRFGKKIKSKKEIDTNVELFTYQRGGVIPKYSIVKRFRSGGIVPSFQEGGEMMAGAAEPTQPGTVEEGAQVQGGEQIFSVEDTQKIIQMVQQIMQTQDQRQQAELLMQLGLFVVEAVMRQMQAGEQTTTTNAPTEQPPTEPMGGGEPVQEAKTGGKLRKSIMDTY